MACQKNNGHVESSLIKSITSDAKTDPQTNHRQTKGPSRKKTPACTETSSGEKI